MGDLNAQPAAQIADTERHQRLLDLVAAEGRPRDHDEWLVYRIAERRCSLATGTWPCDHCLSSVASVIRNIEDFGYKLRQAVIPAAQYDGSREEES